MSFVAQTRDGTEGFRDNKIGQICSEIRCAQKDHGCAIISVRPAGGRPLRTHEGDMLLGLLPRGLCYKLVESNSLAEPIAPGDGLRVLIGSRP